MQYMLWVAIDDLPIYSLSRRLHTCKRHWPLIKPSTAICPHKSCLMNEWRFESAVSE